jgi:hypothetical protein
VQPKNHLDKLLDFLLLDKKPVAIVDFLFLFAQIHRFDLLDSQILQLRVYVHVHDMQKGG